MYLAKEPEYGTEGLLVWITFKWSDSMQKSMQKTPQKCVQKINAIAADKTITIVKLEMQNNNKVRGVRVLFGSFFHFHKACENFF